MSSFLRPRKVASLFKWRRLLFPWHWRHFGSRDHVFSLCMDRRESWTQKLISHDVPKMMPFMINFKNKNLVHQTNEQQINKKSSCPSHLWKKWWCETYDSTRKFLSNIPSLQDVVDVTCQCHASSFKVEIVFVQILWYLDFVVMHLKKGFSDIVKSWFISDLECSFVWET